MKARPPVAGVVLLAMLGASVASRRSMAQAAPAANSTASVVAQAPARFELTWEAPMGCATSSEVMREIEALTGSAAGTPRSAPIIANAVVTTEFGEFSLTLTVRDVEAVRSRHIGAPTCEELSHAAALIVAIAIDPTILERRVDPIQAEAPNLTGTGVAPLTHCRLRDLPISASECRMAVSKAAASSSDAASAEVPLAPLRYHLGLGTFVSHGLLPGVYPGLALSGTLQLTTLRVELALSMLEARVEDNVAGRGANFSLYRATPRLCVMAHRQRWAGGPCAGVDLGYLVGKGYGLPNWKTDTSFWGAATLGGVVEWRVAESTLVGIRGDLGTPFRRDEYQLAGHPLHTPGTISGTLGVSLVAGWR